MLTCPVLKRLTDWETPAHDHIMWQGAHPGPKVSMMGKWPCREPFRGNSRTGDAVQSGWKTNADVRRERKDCGNQTANVPSPTDTTRYIHTYIDCDRNLKFIFNDPGPRWWVVIITSPMFHTCCCFREPPSPTSISLNIIVDVYFICISPAQKCEQR